MEFEDFLEYINKKIFYFCKKYNFLDKKEELLTESFICFKNCKEKFNGDKKEFKLYFLKSLSNHFLNFYIKERKFGNKFLIFEDFEEIEEGVKGEQGLIYRVSKKLNEEEFFILDLKMEGFNLKEIGEKMGISYEKMKDIWSIIKKKLNQKLKSRIEIRRKWNLENKERIKILTEKWRKENLDYFKKWRERNPFYFKDWRKENEGYFRKYKRIERIIKNKQTLNIIKNFLNFLCDCDGKILNIKKESLRVSFICKNCLITIMLFEDLKDEEFDLAVIFSNINSLKNPLNQIRCKRIFIYKNKDFKKDEKFLKKLVLIKKSQIR